MRLKYDGTRAETRFRFSPQWTSPFKSVGASVQSTAGSRGVRISGSNAEYTMFRGSVRVLATSSIRQFLLHLRHRVQTGFKRTLPSCIYVGRKFGCSFSNSSPFTLAIIYSSQNSGMDGIRNHSRLASAVTDLMLSGI